MSAPRRNAGRSWVLAAMTVAALLVTLGGCAEDATTTAESGDQTTLPAADSGLLGPENIAVGEPVKIGQLTDGASAAIDASDELVGGQIAVDHLNKYRGGVAGRPIELVTCEMKADPAGAQDCANKMVAENVVAVAAPQIVYAKEAWTTLHDAGIPLLLSNGVNKDLESDPDSTFIALDGSAGLDLPISLAESSGASKISFVIVDVPQALEAVNSGITSLEAAGLEFEIVPIPLGTPDMVPQMQQVKASGAGVVHLAGNDTFCIAAIQGLRAVGYTGDISGVSQCFTDATRSALAGELEGVNVRTGTAEGATDDPTYELYRAAVDEFGGAIDDIDGYVLSGYVAMATLGEALGALEGDVTAPTATSAIKAMPAIELPVGGGIVIQCGGSAVSDRPAICTNQWLRGVFDANGNPDSYTVEGS